MSLPKDILELRAKRGNLEAEKRLLTEEKKKKREKLRALEQMMIVELANGNEKTRQDVSQLDSSINDLENRLEQVRQEAENQNNELNQANVQIKDGAEAENQNNELNQANVQVRDSALEEPMEEEVSTDTTTESSVPSSKNKDEITTQGSQKKKREFL